MHDDEVPGGAAVAVTVELSVTGMHCMSCVELIEEALAERPGVVSASVDLADGSAVVAFDAGVVGIDEICGVVGEVGYVATVR